ncbi:MAG: translation initiation factor IF-3 [Oscillospiraceae bacterium]|nr:translation initiation factor IF-3 [Oscillospiraceae bacterium]
MPAFIVLKNIRRCSSIASKPQQHAQTQINEEIRDREVRVVSVDGEQLGIMSAVQALHLADEQSLDLVKIAPMAAPPVCKIMDYGKFRFEQSKKEKEARKNQKTIELKEIRLSYKIDIHDFNTKLEQSKKFLAAGHKLKVSIRFRGREMAHANLGRQTMERFAELVAESAAIERVPKLEGRQMLMFLAPKK